ncbi:MAG: hypothetical protein LUH51_04615 [Firmicutes bacterium]|nr:hypothetical protein [Bacillota bacterium]
MLLLYAAGNPAKLPAMRSRLEVIGIHLLGLRDLGAAGKPLPSIVESGSAPSENARKGGACYRGVPDAVLFPRFRLSRAVGIKWTPGAADRKGLASPGFPFTPLGIRGGLRRIRAVYLPPSVSSSMGRYSIY